MAADTKEKILSKALELFAKDGYSGTNLRDLAKELELSKSALYRHFESKEEIMNSAVEVMTAYYEERFGSPEHLLTLPQSLDELYDMTMRMVSFTVHDERIIQLRKILLTEQFRDERIRDLATNYFLTDTEAIFSSVFTELMELGRIKSCDAELLAFSYTTPITALVHLCDREPEREAEAMEKLRRFVLHFIEEYGVN